jgi:tellurite resistance protein
MPGELIVMGIVEVVGGLIAHVGVEAAQARGRTWLDRRDFDKLDDGAKQAFIAGLVFVAAHDGVLSQRELDEIEARLRRLDVEEKGREVALALAAREEVLAAVGHDDAGFAARVLERLPQDGRTRDALVRVAIAVAMMGDGERQLPAVRLLARAAGYDEARIEQTIAAEKSRLIK